VIPDQEADVRTGFTTRLRVTALLATVALGVLAAGPALAQPIDDPWQWNTVSLFDMAPDSEPTLVIRGLLKEDVETPATVALPVPPGSEIIWAGAISGADPSLDQELEVSIEEGEEYDLVSLELTSSPVAQLEMAPPEEWITDEEAVRTVTMSWTSAYELEKALMTFVAPAGFEIAGVDPATEPQPQTDGSSVVSVETSPVAPGQALTLSGQISRSTTGDTGGTGEVVPTQPEQDAATQESSGGQSDSSDLVRILIALALIAGLVIVAVVLFRYASASGSKDEEDLDASDDEPAEEADDADEGSDDDWADSVLDDEDADD
jgi:hypothetical protein